MKSILLIGFLFFMGLGNLVAQINPNLEKDTLAPVNLQFETHRTDTIFVKKRTILVLGDTTFYVPRDTIMQLPDSVIRRMRNYEPGTDSLYNRIRRSLYRKGLTRKLYDIFFQNPNPKKKKINVKSVHYLTYEDAKGKIINSIHYKKLDVFGTDINDTLVQVRTGIINTANDLHLKTQNRVIRNLLFFKEGDKVDPQELKDSERILRTQSFIRDARIYIVQKKGTDAVDIIVVEKDVWSINPELDFSSTDKMTVSLVDKNILGQGHELRNEFHYDNRYTPKIGYLGKYRINNLARSFITTELSYGKTRPFERLGVEAFRNFITPDIKYGFGLEVAREKQEYEYLYPDTVVNFYAAKRFVDIWFGRSIPLKEDKHGRVNLVLSGRYLTEDYFEAPYVSEDTNQFFLDKRQYFISAGITRRDYEKSSLIRGFGRTEDIPKGYTFQLIGAWENNELYNRMYAGVKMESGIFISRLGYFRPGLEFGGFRRNSAWEQGIFRFQLDYFSNLYQYHRFKFRQFFNFNYTRGLDRFDNEYIYINRDDGIRGFKDKLLRGTERLGFSMETVAFTPYYLWGFRFATYLFLDLGLLNSRESNLIDNHLFEGFGFGIRLRNENLAINTIEIRLGYYPTPPSGKSSFGIALTGQSDLDIPDLRIDKPQIFPFR